MEKNKFNKRSIILIPCFIIYIAYIFFSMSKIQLNSDMANMILEANDIIHGNLFLKDWILTGITFITTDLPFFIIGTAIFGVSNWAFVAANTLFFISFLTLSFLFIQPYAKKNKILYVLFFSICAFPNNFYMTMSWVHTGCFFWSFLGIYFAISYKNKNNSLFLVLCLIALALGLAGDSITFLLAIVPILVIEGIELAQESNVRKLTKNDFKIIFYVLGSCLLGILIEKLYLFVGAADKNAYIHNRHFLSLNEIPTHFFIWLDGFFRLFDADFFGKEIVNKSIFNNFIMSVFIIMGIVCIYKSISNLFSKKCYSYPCCVLSVGFLFVSLIYIFTDLSVNLATTRYYSFAINLLTIVVCVNLSFFDFSLVSTSVKKLMSVLIVGAAVIHLCFSVFAYNGFKMIYSSERGTKAYNQQYLEISKLLQEKNLKNGYSSFWSSSVVSVYSKNKVTVRSVIVSDNKIVPFNWFCKKSWYKEPANFFLIQKQTDFGLTRELVLNNFGVPKEEIESGNYYLFIYDKDISVLWK